MCHHYLSLQCILAKRPSPRGYDCHWTLEWLAWGRCELKYRSIGMAMLWRFQRRRKQITPCSQRRRAQGEAMFVDGYDEATKTVYESHGCFYHGCANCFPIHRYRKHNCHPDRTISEIFEATCQKTQKLRQAGYTVNEKWEHDFEIEKKTNPTLMEFLKTFSLSEPLISPTLSLRVKT